MGALGNPNPGSASKLTDKVRTRCKVCQHAILHSEPAVWSRDPLGLIHDYCRRGGA